MSKHPAPDGLPFGRKGRGQLPFWKRLISIALLLKAHTASAFNNYQKKVVKILLVYRNVMDGRDSDQRDQNMAVELEDLGDSAQERGREHA